MAKPIYSAIASLDGYVADQDGNFDWAARFLYRVGDVEEATGLSER